MKQSGSHHESGQGKVFLGSIGVDLCTMAEAMSRIDVAVRDRSRLHVVTANMQFVGLAARDPAFASVVGDAGLVVGDGVPLLWLSRLDGYPIPQRITGHDLVQACAAMAHGRGYRIALLGGTGKAGEIAHQALQSQYPGLEVCGVFGGNFTKEGIGILPCDEDGLLQAIDSARPDILLVGLGCPKQEYWIARHMPSMDVPVCIGIGGVLDVLAGHRLRAPEWMQRSGLEWVYRLMQEPGRLSRRYIGQDLPTLTGLTAGIAMRRVHERLAKS